MLCRALEESAVQEFIASFIFSGLLTAAGLSVVGYTKADDKFVILVSILVALLVALSVTAIRFHRELRKYHAMQNFFFGYLETSDFQKMMDQALEARADRVSIASEQLLTLLRKGLNSYDGNEIPDAQAQTEFDRSRETLESGLAQEIRLFYKTWDQIALFHESVYTKGKLRARDWKVYVTTVPSKESAA